MKIYIVIQTHTQDYISSTVYLTQAENATEAIIACREYNDLGIDDEEERAFEIARLRSLSLFELEQDDRHNGNAWSAEIFTMPRFHENEMVVQVGKLDTD